MDKKSFFERIRKVLPPLPNVMEIGSAQKNHSSDIVNIIEPDKYLICHTEEKDIISKEDKYDFIFINYCDFKIFDEILNSLENKIKPGGYISGDGFIKYMYPHSKINNFLKKNKLKMVFATELGLWAATKI